MKRCLDALRAVFAALAHLEPAGAGRFAPRRARSVCGKRMAVAALAAAISTTGCSWFGPTRTALRDVTVIARDGANDGSATQLDFVFVYDAASAAALPRTGPEWFAQKPRLMVSLGPKIEVASVQLPAAQSLAPVPLPPRHKKALVVYCYVNFVAPAGQGVADLTSFEHVRITLSANTVTYEGDQ